MKTALVVGTGLATILAGALPITLSSLPEPQELYVNVPSPYPYELRPSSAAAPREVKVGPDNVLDRLEGSVVPADPQSGLMLLTWRVEYGHRWVSEVTLPTLIGPFNDEGTDVCGFSVSLGAGLFDTSNAGAGLRDLVRRKIASHFPMTFEKSGVRVEFPALDHLDFSISLGEQEAVVSARIVLVDSTVFTATVPVTLVSVRGGPVVRRVGRITTTWAGPSYESAKNQAREKGAGMGFWGGAGAGALYGGPVGALAGAFLGLFGGSAYGETKFDNQAPEAARGEIERQVDDALGQLAFGLQNLRKPWAPFPSRPSDLIRLRLGGEPSMTPAGIVLPVCTRVTVGGLKRDPAVAGPPQITSTLPVATSVGPEIGLTASADGINQLLYFLWQSGILRQLGTSESVLSVLPPTIRDLAFDVTGFDPGLPPVVMPYAPDLATSGLPLGLANVQIGTWGERTVVGHAWAQVGVSSKVDALDLDATVSNIKVNCTAVDGSARTRLTPCISELVPVANDALREQPLRHRFSGGDLLGGLPALTFQGLKLELSNLRVETHSETVSLDVRVNARLMEAQTIRATIGRTDAVRGLVPVSASASSVYSTATETFGPELAFDGDMKTAWHEGAPGPGRGEWIEANFDRPTRISGISLTTGHNTTNVNGDDVFPRNSHAKRVRVTFDGANDLVREVASDQRLLVIDGLKLTASVVRFTFEDVWPGTRWPALPISEISFESAAN